MISVDVCVHSGAVTAVEIMKIFIIPQVSSCSSVIAPKAPPSPQATTHLCSVTGVSLHFLDSSVAGTKQDVLFLPGFFHLARFLLDSFVVCVSGEFVHFYDEVVFYSVTHNLSVHLPADGHFCCFQFLDFTNCQEQSTYKT